MTTSMPVKPIIIRVSPPARCPKCGGTVCRGYEGGECFQCGAQYPFRVIENYQELIDAVNRKIEKASAAHRRVTPAVLEAFKKAQAVRNENIERRRHVKP